MVLCMPIPGEIPGVCEPHENRIVEITRESEMNGATKQTPGTFLVVACLCLLGGCQKPSATPTTLQHLWTFEAPSPGLSLAAPLVTEEGVFLSAIHVRGFQLDGAIYALDPGTGRRRWTFDRNGDLCATASTPVFAKGRIHFGEGSHQDAVSRVFGVDAATGEERWSVLAHDHVEASPTIHGDLLVTTAGSDGVYALSVADGQVRWHFQADVHLDSTPAVHDGRVIVGSGPSRQQRRCEVMALEANSGRLLWRTPTRLPAWGEPVAVGERVFVGLGNGKFNAPPQDEPSAGALLCLNARTGRELWEFPVGGAVFGRPLVLSDSIYFGSREGFLYAVAPDGTLRHRVDLGGSVMAAPVLGPHSVLAVSVPGRVVCLDPSDGRERWRYEWKQDGFETLVHAAPVVANGRLYLTAEMQRPGAASGIVTLSCFALPPLPEP